MSPLRREKLKQLGLPGGNVKLGGFKTLFLFLKGQRSLVYLGFLLPLHVVCGEPAFQSPLSVTQLLALGKILIAPSEEQVNAFNEITDPDEAARVGKRVKALLNDTKLASANDQAVGKQATQFVDQVNRLLEPASFSKFKLPDLKSPLAIPRPSSPTQPPTPKPQKPETPPNPQKPTPVKPKSEDSYDKKQKEKQKKQAAEQAAKALAKQNEEGGEGSGAGGGSGGGGGGGGGGAGGGGAGGGGTHNGEPSAMPKPPALPSLQNPEASGDSASALSSLAGSFSGGASSGSDGTGGENKSSADNTDNTKDNSAQDPYGLPPMSIPSGLSLSPLKTGQSLWRPSPAAQPSSSWIAQLPKKTLEALQKNSESQAASQAQANQQGAGGGAKSEGKPGKDTTMNAPIGNASSGSFPTMGSPSSGGFDYSNWDPKAPNAWQETQNSEGANGGSETALEGGDADTSQPLYSKNNKKRTSQYASLKVVPSKATATPFEILRRQGNREENLIFDLVPRGESFTQSLCYAGLNLAICKESALLSGKKERLTPVVEGALQGP